MTDSSVSHPARHHGAWLDARLGGAAILRDMKGLSKKLNRIVEG